MSKKGEVMTRFYQIRVRGHLSDKRAECFRGLTIENQPIWDETAGEKQPLFGLCQRKACTRREGALAF